MNGRIKAARVWKYLNRIDSTSVFRIFFIGISTGIIGASISLLYFLALESLVSLVWTRLFNALTKAGVFNQIFLEYNFVWMGSLLYIISLVFFLFFFNASPAGSFGGAIEQIHQEGRVSQGHFFPMLILSLLSLSSGSGVGPEAPIMILSGSASSFFGRRLRLQRRPLRVFVLSGISAALSGFFGSPLTGLFALEMPHRLGIEYFEALVPVMISSFAGATIMQALLQRNYGSYFSFSSHSDDVAAIDLLIGLLLGLAASLVGMTFLLSTRVFSLMSSKASRRLQPFLPLFAWPIFSVAGMLLPPVLFWGKPEMQNIINLNLGTPLYHWQGGSSGLIELGEGYSSLVVFLIAVVKLFLLPCVAALNLKGGIVFPLFFIGGTFGQGIHMVTGIDQALAVCSMMAATQACVTRTPLSSALVAVLNAKNAPSQLLIPVAAASFLSTLLTTKVGIFPSQGPREDLHPSDEGQEEEDPDADEEGSLLPPNEASPLIMEEERGLGDNNDMTGLEEDEEAEEEQFGRPTFSIQSVHSLTLVRRDHSGEHLELLPYHR